MSNIVFGLCDADYFTRFLCYQDITFALKQFISKPCNYKNIVGINEFKNNSSDFKTYPNPANDI